MKHPLCYLLCPALIPELCSDVAASSSCNVHLVLVCVAAVGALPDELAVHLFNLDLTVEAAYLAEVRFCVELCVHDVVVDELHHANDGLEVVLHVGHLDVGDGSAGGEVLERALKLQLGEGVDLLGHVDVVAVCDVALVGDAGDDAEATLQAFGDLVGHGLDGRAVDGVVDVFRGLPLGAAVVHVLHDGERNFTLPAGRLSYSALSALMRSEAGAPLYTFTSSSL